MNFESHERARTLLAEARVEGISPDERQWLNAHLDGCDECSSEATALTAAIQSLRSLSVTASAQTVRRASLAVQQRAEELRRERERSISLWIATALSSAWAIVIAPVAWSVFTWLGRMFAAPAVLLLVGFLVWWFFPATVLAAVIVWQRSGERTEMGVL
jgi:anti-sigma factor RsiW